MLESVLPGIGMPGSYLLPVCWPVWVVEICWLTNLLVGLLVESAGRSKLPSV